MAPVIALLLITLCLTSTTEARADKAAVIVKVEQGLVQGELRKTPKGRTYVAFEGIPYAEPLTEEQRFQVSQPKKPWNGVWKADKPGSPCLQYRHALPGSDKIIGEEDCLYANIYTSKLPENETTPKLDVIVFIHGGAFMFGSGDMYGPNYYMEKDVVYITFNYRVGILGFLSTEDDVIPGNNGLKDQVEALKWIKKNVATFGGDPSSITLTGQSAGGASVHYHYLSPLSQGLFHKGISLSGTAFCPWALSEGMRTKAEMLGVCMGCSVKFSQELLDCLRNRPARKIVACTEIFQAWLYNPFSPFGPTIEKGGEYKFLTDSPTDLMIERQIQDIPWITGVTTAEGLYPVTEFLENEDLLEELNEKFDQIAPSLLDYNYTVPSDQHEDISEIIRNHYFGQSAIGKHNIKQLINMVGDWMFVLHAVNAAQLQANINTAPVYFYQYGYRGKHSISEIFSKTTTNYGAGHCDDIVYLTDTEFIITNETEEDREMTDLLLDIVTNFTKSKGTIQLQIRDNIRWAPVVQRQDELNYLYIGSPKDLEIRKTQTLGNRAFWHTMPLQESEKEIVLTPRLVDEL